MSVAVTWMEENLTIKTKTGQIVPFRANKHQRRLIDRMETMRRAGLPVRVLALKTRQVGITTAVQGYFAYLQAEEKVGDALTMAHDANVMRDMEAVATRFLGSLGAKPSATRRDDEPRRLVLPNGARWVIEAATTREPGKSHLVNLLHLSEVAYWSDPHPFLAAIQTVPDKPGTVIVLEATGNGIDPIFYPRWQRAVVDISDYIPFFVPWWDVDEYRKPVPDGRPFVPTPEEQTLMRRFELSPEQIHWRRWTIANLFGGDERRFQVEYPSTPEEAFELSGPVERRIETRNIITQRVMDAIAERDADIRPYCDITVKVQDGKPVMVEILSKHKPTV